MTDVLKNALDSIEGVFDSEENIENLIRRKVLIEMRAKLTTEIDELTETEHARRQQLVDDVAKMSFADINNMSHHPEQVKSGDIISSEDRRRKTRWNYGDDDSSFKPSRSMNDVGNPMNKKEGAK